jgi:iron complex outermembrane receptor protein
LQTAVGTDNVASCQVSQRSGFQAPFSASLTSEYTFPVSSHVDAYLRGLLNFSGNSRTDPTNIYDDVGSYGLVNMFAGIRDPKGAWEVSLFAKNLFDTTKTLSRTNPLLTSYLIPTGATTTVAATYTSTYTGVTSTALREFGINVRYAFGSR